MDAHAKKLERTREWRRNHKEHRKAYRAAYNKANPDKTSKMKARWYDRHKDEVINRVQNYRANNLERLREYDRIRNKSPKRIEARLRRSAELRNAVLGAYGRVCKCCGESNEMMLTIDHINNDGAAHRESTDFGSYGFYGWLVRNKFPEGFQTLCFGCNWGKHRNGGTCPHVKESEIAFLMIGAC